MPVASYYQDPYDEDTASRPIYGPLEDDTFSPRDLIMDPLPLDITEEILDDIAQFPGLSDDQLGSLSDSPRQCALWAGKREDFEHHLTDLSHRFNFTTACPGYIETTFMLYPSAGSKYRKWPHLSTFVAVLPSSPDPELWLASQTLERGPPMLVPLFMPWGKSKVHDFGWRAYVGTFSVWPLNEVPLDENYPRNISLARELAVGLARRWHKTRDGLRRPKKFTKERTRHELTSDSIEVIALGFRFEGYDHELADAFAAGSAT